METKSAILIPSGVIHRYRKLSRNGTVMVYPNQTTDPMTLIARRSVWRHHYSIDAASFLDLHPGEKIRDYLLIEEGAVLAANDVIAQNPNNSRLPLVARNDCRFLGISSGNLIFEKDPEDIESVYAGFPGVVSEIIPGRGARIETKGAFVHGVWGNGKSGQGILLTLDDIERRGIFSAGNLSMAMSGSIIFANSCYDGDVLRAASRLSPGGMIFGSLPARLLPIAESLPFPIIVTDMIGIGRFSTPVMDILGENIIKCAYLYSAPIAHDRPFAAEIIIPQNTESGPARQRRELKLGSQVRILEGFYSGEIGFVTELIPWNENVEAEVLTHEDQIRVQIDALTEIVLPATNVEIIHL